jgi:hypothetical protein
MAIYYLNHGFISRSSGKSAVSNDAYITGLALRESRRDLGFNYKNRLSDIAFTNTLAPEHVPQQFHNVGVWDALETLEDVYADKLYPRNLEYRDKHLRSAQIAQTIVVALPRELAAEIDKELVEEFAKERFVSRGLIVTYAIRVGENNPHAHLQISRRSVTEKEEFSGAKDREIASRQALLETRKLWADLTNKYLEREGFEVRISEKSLEDLGITRAPSKRLGWRFHKQKREAQRLEVIAKE